MVFKNGVKNIQTAGYNGARTVLGMEKGLIMFGQKKLDSGHCEYRARKDKRLWCKNKKKPTYHCFHSNQQLSLLEGLFSPFFFVSARFEILFWEINQLGYRSIIADTKYSFSTFRGNSFLKEHSYFHAPQRITFFVRFLKSPRMSQNKPSLANSCKIAIGDDCQI